MTNSSVYYKLVCIIRYWNDKDVLKKLGEAMGFSVAGETAASNETVPDETEEESEDESIVHQCASIGDLEVPIQVNSEFSMNNPYQIFICYFIYLKSNAYTFPHFLFFILSPSSSRYSCWFKKCIFLGKTIYSVNTKASSCTFDLKLRVNIHE